MKKIYQSFYVLAGLALLFAACDGMMDVHKEYIKDGEIIYAPKLDTSVFYSGKERMYFIGALWNAPNVKTVDIFWNNGRDSLITPVSPTEGEYAFEINVPLNEEKAYTFDVRTTDIFGHHSLKTLGTASSYGAMYQSSLNNRYIKLMTLEGNRGEISWLPAAEGLVRSEVRYTDINDQQKVIHVRSTESLTVCSDAKRNTNFEYRSLFLPETASIDTFEVAWEAINYYSRSRYDLARDGWGSILSHPHISESLSDYDHLDSNNDTYIALTKPGRSKDGITVAPDEDVYFIVNMGTTPQEFNYFRVRHRNSPGNMGARWQDVSIYGSNDNSAWTPIALNVTIPGEAEPSLIETDNIDLPLSSYRYVKVLLARWDTVNNSNAQMSEFYLGRKPD